MAYGTDQAGMASRLRTVLPRGWFADTAAVLAMLLAGFGAEWAGVYTLLTFVQQQARVSTATGDFLSLAAQDFLGTFPRLVNETDSAYSVRLRREAMRERVTRAGVVQALIDLTGRTPQVFEPADTTDTGGYRFGGLGYGVAGGYGSLRLPAQYFVTAYRPHGGGIAQVGGYRTGGYLAYGSESLVQGQVTDAAIYSAIAGVTAGGVTAWTRISN